MNVSKMMQITTKRYHWTCWIGEKHADL